MNTTKAKINVEKVPKNYGARVYWQVSFGGNSERQTSKLFKNKKLALEFAKTKVEETPSHLDVYVHFRDGSQKEVKNQFKNGL